MGDEVKFIDAEGYIPSKDGISFREIVLNHVRRIGNMASREWKGGYWEYRTRSVNGVETQDKYYVPDTREEYSNAVDYLLDILFPHFDKIMMEKAREHSVKLKELHQRYYGQISEDDKYDEDDIKNSFRDRKVVVQRLLFRELNCFLYRQKYMEGQAFEDVV